MRRRIRSLEIVSNLQRLSELGFDTAASADDKAAFMLEVFRANALAGQFDHLSAFVDPVRLAVDVGANVGQYALKLAALCPKVLVIEPSPAMGWLPSRLPHNCLFYNGAAGERSGTEMLSIPLHEGRQQSGRATLTAVYGEAIRHSVPVRTLDELLDEFCPGEPVGFIKIDAEGWSTAVLRGAAETLSRWRPNLQVELWPEQMAETMDLLASWGYRGLFGFDGRLFDIGRFDPAVHAAPEQAWHMDQPEMFDPTLFVGDFFFIPVDYGSYV